MNRALEIKRKRLEMSRVAQSEAELAFKIEELNDQILRIKEHIEVQKKTQERLSLELQALEQGG